MISREVVIVQLFEARKALDEAKENYRRVMILAKTNGWNNTEIAGALGVSEGAIRMHFKRHPIRT